MAAIYNIKTKESSSSLYAPWSTGSRSSLNTVTLKGYSVSNMNDYYGFINMPFVGLIEFGKFRYLTAAMHGSQPTKDVLIVNKEIT